MLDGLSLSRIALFLWRKFSCHLEVIPHFFAHQAVTDEPTLCKSPPKDDQKNGGARVKPMPADGEHGIGERTISVAEKDNIAIFDTLKMNECQ